MNDMWRTSPKRCEIHQFLMKHIERWRNTGKLENNYDSDLITLFIWLFLFRINYCRIEKILVYAGHQFLIQEKFKTDLQIYRGYEFLIIIKDKCSLSYSLQSNYDSGAWKIRWLCALDQDKLSLAAH